MKKGELGKKAEADVKLCLDKLKEQYTWFDYTKLRDARSSSGKGAVKQISDFQLFIPNAHIALEVKTVNHTHLLPNKNVTQLPKMHRRVLAGGLGFFLVYFTPLKLWRVVGRAWMEARKTKPSYDFTGIPTVSIAKEAIKDILKPLGVKF